MTTAGDALLALKERSGLSLAQIADAAGYKTASAIQRFFNRTYNPRQPNPQTGAKLAQALVGRGTPPIKESEVMNLFKEVRLDDLDPGLGGGWVSKRQTIPVTPAHPLDYGHDDDDLSSVEVFDRLPSKAHVEKPAHLNEFAMGAFHMPVSNMTPRIEVGDLVVFEATRPIRPGHLAFVRVEAPVDRGFVEFVARIDRFERGEVIFSQFKPSCQFSVPQSRIRFVARVMSAEDILPPMQYALT